MGMDMRLFQGAHLSLKNNGPDFHKQARTTHFGRTGGDLDQLEIEEKTSLGKDIPFQFPDFRSIPFLLALMGNAGFSNWANADTDGTFLNSGSKSPETMRIASNKSTHPLHRTRLEERDVELLRTWAKNQKLSRYFGTADIDGRKYHQFEYRLSDFERRIIYFPVYTFNGSAIENANDNLLRELQNDSNYSMEVSRPVENRNRVTIIDDPEELFRWARDGQINPFVKSHYMGGHEYWRFSLKNGSEVDYQVPESKEEKVAFRKKMEYYRNAKLTVTVADPSELRSSRNKPANQVVAPQNITGPNFLERNLSTLLWVSLAGGLGYAWLRQRDRMADRGLASMGGAMGAAARGGQQDPTKVNYRDKFKPKFFTGVSRKTWADIGGQKVAVEDVKELIERYRARKTLRLEYLLQAKILKQVVALQQEINAEKAGEQTKVQVLEKLRGLFPQAQAVLSNNPDIPAFLAYQKEELETKIKELAAESEKLGKIEGVLMTGPPGTGKTLLAAIIASELDAPIIMTDGSKFGKIFYGSGSAAVESMYEEFREAEQKYGIAFLFIDEVDGISNGSGSPGSTGGNQEDNKTLAAMKTEMDKVDDAIAPVPANLFLLGATNKPWLLDDALKRPGRMGKEIKMTNPAGWQERKEILEIYYKKLGLNVVDTTKDRALEHLARLTIGESGAKLEKYMNQAKLLREKLLHTELDAAIKAAEESGELPRSAREITERYNQYLESQLAALNIGDEPQENKIEGTKILPTFTQQEVETIVAEYKLLEAVKNRAAHDEIGGCNDITQELLVDAKMDADLGPVLPLEKFPSEYEHLKVLLHEFGHMFAALINGMMLYDISGQPRTSGVMGYVSPNPEGSAGYDGNHPYSEKIPTLNQYLANLFIGVSGNSMEKASYGDTGVTPGAGNDLQKAEGIIRDALGKGLLQGSYKQYQYPGEPLAKQDAKRQQIMMDTVVDASRAMMQYFMTHHRETILTAARELIQPENIAKRRGPDGSMEFAIRHFGLPKILADRMGQPELYRPDFWSEPERIIAEYMKDDTSWKRVQEG